jgi:hypothetical protein
MLGPWAKEDVLSLLATLRMSLKVAPEGVPGEISHPQASPEPTPPAV